MKRAIQILLTKKLLMANQPAGRQAAAVTNKKKI